MYCAGCSKPILSESSITALNQTWHADCFRCAACGKPIGQERLFLANESWAIWHCKTRPIGSRRFQFDNQNQGHLAL